MSSLLTTSVSCWTSSILGLTILLVSYSIDGCSAARSMREQRKVVSFRQVQSLQDEFPWLAQDDDKQSLEDDWYVQSRVRRSANESSGSKSVWQKIEEFYADDNNMAMFCVLPVMILIYGGCSSIYCIYKCRQYLRRSKHKRLKEEDCESLTSDSQGAEKLNRDKDRPVSQISQAWADLHGDPSEKKWSGQTEGVGPGFSSPLPWQAPSKMGAAAALALTTKGAHGEKMGDTAICLDEKKGIPQLADVRRHPDIHGLAEAHNRLPHRQPATVRPADPKHLEAARADVNMADYATNRFSAAKATDFSRFSDSRPIEIIPLSADPNLRVWDPLHKRPFGQRDKPGASGNRPESVQAMKEELLARYDALSTLQMAKRAAEILSTNAVEKNPFQRKPGKKKHIYIAE
ncbi:hypothetical protein BsWGS_09114 [Bradybaena similaris]